MNAKFIPVALICLLPTLGCFTKTYAISTNPRPAIADYKVVRIFQEEPTEPYEFVGTIEVERKQGFGSRQGDIDAALTAMKKKAAKIGANAVILQQKGDRSSGAIVPLMGGAMVGSFQSATVLNAKAVFINI